MEREERAGIVGAGFDVGAATKSSKSSKQIQSQLRGRHMQDHGVPSREGIGAVDFGVGATTVGAGAEVGSSSSKSNRFISLTGFFGGGVGTLDDLADLDAALVRELLAAGLSSHSPASYSSTSGSVRLLDDSR